MKRGYVSKCFEHPQVRGFFRGMGFPLVAVGFLNSVFFGVYGNTLRFLNWSRHGTSDGPPSMLNNFIAGGVGGGVQAIPCAPIELVKVQLQAQMRAQAAASRGRYHITTD